jgi:hypothetical protein
MDDIVDRLTTLFWTMKDAGRLQDKNLIADVIAEIERLRHQTERLSVALDDISHLTADHQVQHRIKEAQHG